MGSQHRNNMKVFIALATLVTVSLSRPKFLVIPMENVEFGQNMNLPVYRMPQLARQARAAQEDLDSASQDSFQIAPLAQARQYNALPYSTAREDSEPSGSSTTQHPSQRTTWTMEATPETTEPSAGTQN